ncbi:MAG: UvrD-helicase domain-containing protein [Limnohabitans sp.]|nr:UvrD-helicase domain-containing protein [Limnohabitans sp.]
MLTSLNPLQKKAVTSTSNRLLVLAGAGSGKTKTLLQKIHYLLDVKKAQASEILAITFSKNAANEMIDRLIMDADKTGAYKEILENKNTTAAQKNKYRLEYQQKFKWIGNLQIRTFHSFCYKLMQTYGVKEFDNKFKLITDDKTKSDEAFSKLSADETVFEVFHKLIIEACEDFEYIYKFKRFILDYYIDKIHLLKQDLKIYPKGKFYSTLQGEKVRSKSEQSIADWLFRHNIRYVYEPNVNTKEFTFKPDFYLVDANIYLEHISSLSADTSGKERQFAKGHIQCVKTFEEDMNDSAYFNKIMEKYVKGKIKDSDTPLHRKLQYLEEFAGYQEEIKDFIRDCVRICDMIKVENVTLDHIYAQSQLDPHERIRLFYEMAMPIITSYLKYCTDKSYLDFNDLINKAVQLLEHNNDIKKVVREQFNYILVDEYQDVNNLQVELLKAIIKPTTKLFCVGDDWQSIYGFRGSNVEHILHFETTFKNAKTIKLNLNYRSSESIVQASNEVIKHNKFKIDKEIVSSRKSTIKLYENIASTKEENVLFAVEKVQELLDSGIPNEEILFLYRRSKMFQDYYFAFRNHGIKIQNKTIHAAKGLEAKVVFIIGLTEGRGGFPDIWLEDRIFQVIKKANHEQLMEEERRLFYVAITRAKDQLFLLTEKGNVSRFLAEIPESLKQREAETLFKEADFVLCKNCKTQNAVGANFCSNCGKKIK